MQRLRRLWIAFALNVIGLQIVLWHLSPTFSIDSVMLMLNNVSGTKDRFHLVHRDGLKHSSNGISNTNIQSLQTLTIENKDKISAYTRFFSTAPVFDQPEIQPGLYKDVCSPTSAELTSDQLNKIWCNGLTSCIVPFCRCKRLQGDNSTPLLDDGTVIIHLYWDGNDPNNSSLIMCLDSILLTQNLAIIKVWVWAIQSNVLDPGSVFALRYKNQVEIGTVSVKEWVWKDMIATSLLSKEIGTNGTYDEKDLEAVPVRARSDVFRFIALHRYGGIYLDTDNIVTRDLLHLVANDCEWSAASGRFYNNHVLILRRNSPTAAFLLRAIAKFPWNKPTAWPAQPYTRLVHWAYNDGVTQYCQRLSTSCRLYRLPLFLVDHHMANICPRLFHTLGCEHSLTGRNANLSLREDLRMSTQLFTLHRHVPDKSQCNPNASGHSNGGTADSLLFSGIFQHALCSNGSAETCFRTEPKSLRSLLLDYDLDTGPAKLVSDSPHPGLWDLHVYPNHSDSNQIAP